MCSHDQACLLHIFCRFSKEHRWLGWGVLREWREGLEGKEGGETTAGMSNKQTNKNKINRKQNKIYFFSFLDIIDFIKEIKKENDGIVIGLNLFHSLWNLCLKTPI